MLNSATVPHSDRPDYVLTAPDTTKPNYIDLVITHGSQKAAAEAIGMKRSTFNMRYMAEREIWLATQPARPTQSVLDIAPAAPATEAVPPVTENVEAPANDTPETVAPAKPILYGRDLIGKAMIDTVHFAPVNDPTPPTPPTTPAPAVAPAPAEPAFDSAAAFASLTAKIDAQAKQIAIQEKVLEELSEDIAAGTHKAAPAAFVPQPVKATVPAEPRQTPTFASAFHQYPPDEVFFDRKIFGLKGERSRLVGDEASTELKTRFCIPDTHFDPDPEFSAQTRRCMTLIGQHAAKVQPHSLYWGGDAGDMKSVNNKVGAGTTNGKTKPSIPQDLDCIRSNTDALMAVIDECAVTTRRHYGKGNHCQWLWDHENSHPSVKGTYTAEFDEIFTGNGFGVSDYGVPYYLGGVAYLHALLNQKGVAISTSDTLKSIADVSTTDTVFFHTHRFGASVLPKADRNLTVVNGGCAMPEGYVGDFAQKALGNRLNYGVLEITDFDGRIQGVKFTTMRELEHHYGAIADKRLRRTGR